MKLPAPGTWTRRIGLAGAGAALLAAGVGAGLALAGRGDDPAGPTGRQAEVAERGAEVMPFDLDRTTHVFTARPGGGVQVVTADDPDDAEQVRLVRAHLGEEAGAFAGGDFGDPASIHGADMPGLAALQAGADRIAVSYQDVPAGGQLTYTTSDPALVEALHAWFDAQVSDHGSHAEHG
jgi:hypothetical protein